MRIYEIMNLYNLSDHPEELPGQEVRKIASMSANAFYKKHVRPQIQSLIAEHNAIEITFDDILRRTKKGKIGRRILYCIDHQLTQFEIVKSVEHPFSKRPRNVGLGDRANMPRISSRKGDIEWTIYNFRLADEQYSNFNFFQVEGPSGRNEYLDRDSLRPNISHIVPAKTYEFFQITEITSLQNLKSNRLK